MTSDPRFYRPTAAPLMPIGPADEDDRLSERRDRILIYMSLLIGLLIGTVAGFLAGALVYGP